MKFVEYLCISLNVIVNVIVYGNHVSLEASLKCLVRFLDGEALDYDQRNNLKKLVVTMYGLATSQGVSEGIVDSIPALKQAMSWLDLVPRGLELVVASRDREISVEECVFMQQNFQAATLEEGWVSIAKSEVSKVDLEEKVATALWPKEIRKMV